MKDNIYEKRDRQPKRRKDKYNPYEIFSVGINTDNPAFYIRFKDSNGIMICTEISREVYEAFNEFELEDLSHLNEKDRHTEHCELTDNDIYGRALLPTFSVENEVSNMFIDGILMQSIKSLIIYNSTTQTVLERKEFDLGKNISFSLVCPSDANPSHDIRILFYAGVLANTAGNAVEYKNLSIEFSADGVNKGCGSAFSSVDALYNQLAMRITGDVEFTANWSEEDFNIQIVPIEPNAPYRLGTEVITSYWVVNCNSRNIIPDDEISVLMTVQK